VAYNNGAPVRLGDVAEVQDAVADVRNIGIANGKGDRRAFWLSCSGSRTPTSSRPSTGCGP
jgi:hypothetical protein